MISDIKKPDSEKDYSFLQSNKKTEIKNPKLSQFKPAKKSRLQDFILIFIIIVLAFFILIPSLIKKNEMAPGADIGSHVYIAKYLVDFIKENGALPAVNPYWYAGWEAYHNTPKITPILIGLGYLLSGNIIRVSQIAQVLVIIFAALVMYFVIRKKHSSLSAFLGAILFVFGPAFLFDIIYLGSYPRSSSMALAPICFYLIENIFNRKNVLRSIVLGALFFSLGILTHPLAGSALVLFFTIYIVLRIFGTRKYRYVKFAGLFFGAIIMLLSLGLAAFYLAPFFMEKSGWYKLPETLSLANSIRLPDLSLRIGFPLIILIIFFLVRKKISGSWPLFITGFIALLFGLGDYGPVYRFFSFTNIYPFLGVMFAAFAFSYVIAMNFDKYFRQKKKKLLILALALFVVYIASIEMKHTEELKIAQSQFLQPQTLEVVSKIETYPNKGRLIPMKYPFDFLLWWLTINKRSLYEGWYYSTTLQGQHIAWIYDAVNHEFPEYALRRFEQLKIRYLLLTRNFFGSNGEQNLKLLEAAKENGFKEVEVIKGPYFREPTYHLLLQDKPTNFLSPLEEKIIVIGKHAMPATAILPGAIQGSSVFLDDYDLELLKNFDTIIFVGFSLKNKEKGETLIKELSRLNKKIIIDMNDSNGSILEQNLIFLDVSSYKEIYKEPLFLTKNEEFIKEIPLFPVQLEIPEDLNENFNESDPESAKNPRKMKLKEWRFSSYNNLDKIYARLQNEQDNSFGVFGYKEINGNKVWFIGPNIFYHAYLTKNSNELTFLREFSKSEKTSSEKANFNLSEENLNPEKGNLKFSFESDKPFFGLISFCFSPHWNAYLDNNKIEIYSLEDLMLVNLPEGKHKLEMRYENLPLHNVSRTISVSTLIVLIILFIFGLVKKKKSPTYPPPFEKGGGKRRG